MTRKLIRFMVELLAVLAVVSAVIAVIYAAWFLFAFANAG